MCGLALRGQCTTVNGTVIMLRDYYCCWSMFAGLKLHVHCFICSRCGDQIRGSFYEDKHTGKSLCTDCHQVIIPKVDTYLYYLLQMINVGKQREMFRVSESNCGQISHSQREQTASRMLHVCMLLALDNINT